MTAICFWCRKPKDGEQTLDPCPECAAAWAKGITLFEAIPAEGGPEYTGRWAVVTEAVVPLLYKAETVPQVLAKRKALIEAALFTELFVKKEGE